uniref:6-cysteine protein n=1 Tax=Parastrongyloides trichosuri TaxID=131310 RepID=A0A0N4ZIB1_PARTI
MKSIPFMVTFLITVLGNKIIYDSKKDGSRIDDLSVKSLIHGNNYQKFDIKFSTERFLEEEINIFEHVSLKNVIVLPVDISRIKPENNGINIIYNGNYEQTFGTSTTERRYLDDGEQTECHIKFCHLGLFFYHSTSRGRQLIDKKVGDFKNVIYIELITSTNEYLFSSVKINSNHFPLIICPYENWVAKQSKVEFDAYERSGIIFNKFHMRSILLPIYERHEGEGKFMCGELKYATGNKLRIGFEVVVRKTEKEIKPKAIDIYKEDLVCNSENKVSDYYHFSYNNKNKNNFSMKYMNMERSKKISIFHNDIIYLYNKTDKRIEDLKENGTDNVNPRYEHTYVFIEPSCRIRTYPIFTKMKLHRIDGKDINLIENNKSDTQILYVTKDLLNKRIDLNCVIEVNDEGSRYNLKDFYKNTFKGRLELVDNSNNHKGVKELRFTKDFHDFGEYKCIVESLNSEITDFKSIVSLSFETIPEDNEVFVEEEKWEDMSTVFIICSTSINYFADLINMKVRLNGKYLYDMSKNKDMIYFSNEGSYVKFKRNELSEKKREIRKAYIECIYKTKNNVIFSRKINGLTLQRTIKSRNSLIYGDGFRMTIIISLIGIITLVVLSTITIIVILKIKSSRRRHLHHHKSRDKSSSCSKSKSYSKSKSHSKPESKQRSVSFKSTERKVFGKNEGDIGYMEELKAKFKNKN